MIYNNKRDSIFQEGGFDLLADLIERQFNVPVSSEQVEGFVFDLNKHGYLIKSQMELKDLMLEKPVEYVLRKRGSAERERRGNIVGYFQDIVGGHISIVAVIIDSETGESVKIPVRDGNIRYV